MRSVFEPSVKTKGACKLLVLNFKKDDMERLRALREQFPEFRFCYWGQALMGLRCKLILVSNYEDFRSEEMLSKSRAWYDYTLRCRLIPGGKIIHL